MSGLLASRWASAPTNEQNAVVPSKHEEQSSVLFDAQAELDSANVISERKDDEALSAVAEDAEDETLPKVVAEDPPSINPKAKAPTDPVQAEEKPSANDVASKDSEAIASPAVEITGEIVEPKLTSPTKIDIARLEPPRLKKHVSFRGKRCVINIPNIDYAAHGLPVPMDSEEVRARIQGFEDEGYSTSGFDDAEDRQMSNKPIYPVEPAESERRQNHRPIVSLPDLNAWKNYMQAVTEAKLAALGVSLGDDEPLSGSQAMSRQSSGPFTQPFSPPLTTGSSMSMGRPAFIRGHSHTMSVASPTSPLNGPFGHMHRHSTFSLTPQQAQELARQSALSGLQSFSPQPQIASPAHFNALRYDLGAYRGPGSPLTQSMTPDPAQEYNRLRQAGYIQAPAPVMTPRNPEPIPTLPELPEDEDEAEPSDSTPYVPPYKRGNVNEEIVIPTPRGHRHNISEGLEREVMQTERHETNGTKAANGRLNGFGQAPQLFGQVSDQVPAEKDPLSGDFSVAPSNHGHKKSASRFNVAAPAFTFNPAATFNPGPAAFDAAATFKPSSTASNVPSAGPIHVAKHTRQTSSGNFNVAAPEFKPSGTFNFTAPIAEEKTPDSTSVPTSGFSFAASGPKFSADAPEFKLPAPTERTIVDALPSIFGKIDIPDIVKPTRRSKAISIVPPSDSNVSASATDVDAFDAEGRAMRSDERSKRSRRGGDDGDEVPRFAEPTALPGPALSSQDVEKPSIAEKPLPELPQDTQKDMSDTAERDVVLEPSPKHQPTSSLSALARPWQPPGAINMLEEERKAMRSPSVSSLEDGEIVESNVPEAPSEGFTFPAAPAHHTQPSFADIDAVMQHLNADDEPARAPPRELSPQRQDSYEPQKGVTYISAWPRSDAPSPSPRRQPAHSPPPFDAQNVHALNANAWPHINKLNKAQGPPSDWSDMLSPAEDHKLQARSSFFDDRVDDVIGRVLADRLRPFEEALQNIQSSLTKQSPSMARQLTKSRSTEKESDADDEDDSDAQLQRPISRGRDQKLGHIKAVVAEALREQSVHRQSAYDIADLHSALADMKVSFARVASTSLELDDIRAIVEDVASRQSQAIVPLAADDDADPTAHKREVADLENRLNQTLTNSLEQANRIHEVEQREAEARRMLKLAEEELRLLRDTNQDDGSRVKALEEEHRRLLDQVEEAEDAQAKAEARHRSMEAENEALSSTLEEYRLSSNKWRSEADEHKHERQSLQHSVTALERQLEEYSDSGSSMRRRLEKLHADLATAMGQITSEKAQWSSKEQSYRAQCDALARQNAELSEEKRKIDQQVLALQARVDEVDAAKKAFEGLRGNQSSLDEMVTGLQEQLTEQQQLAKRFEQESTEAKDAGRAEAHRITIARNELEAEIAKVRAEHEHSRLQAEAAKDRHTTALQTITEDHQELLQKTKQTHDEAIGEVHAKHKSTIEDMTKQHTRSLAHAVEDKERSEYILNERLALAEAKLQHFQDKILHLEDRVEVAKSAAQAAVMNKSTRSVPSPRSSIPEKISPQALRESILVLQEQLQDRESRIESLQHQLKNEGPQKIKERDTEISWLRELLAVRSEDLTDLINTLSKPTFDRDAVRDTAIRIRANLQMEQQEKERLNQANDFPTQAIASLASFATPKAAQLSSAFNKWRASMESTALKSRSSSRTRSYTPSRSRVTSGGRPNYGSSGLMTPPASNLRTSPSPEALSSLPAPNLETRHEPQPKSIDMSIIDSRSREEPSGQPTTPTLLGDDTYDDDAEDRPTAIEDEDLDIADSQPPAFRNLDDELTQPAEAGAEEL